MHMRKLILPFLFLYLISGLHAQRLSSIRWGTDGNTMVEFKKGQVVQTDIASGQETVLVSSEQLKYSGAASARPGNYALSTDQSKLLLFTNTARVWRYNTRGDYWLLDRKAGAWKQIGKGRPAQSLMFAKLSPDGTKVAFVSEKNLYVEDLATGTEKALTTDGTRKLINGTFDWVYEEELNCRDGFRWGPDGKSIAYWQVDAEGTPDYHMINYTDSIYPKVIPVEYPKVGQTPSSVRIGVVDVNNAQTKWMDIPGDARQHYLPRMEWNPDGKSLVVQQLNRKQNESLIFSCNAQTGSVQQVYAEKDDAWVDFLSSWARDYSNGGWDWLSNGTAFLWASEKDGWRHLYRVSADGKKESLLTTGNYDVIDIIRVDEKGGFVYFEASPENATQQYLYRSRLDGKGSSERLSPQGQSGSHDYEISPNAKYAKHVFSNVNTPNTTEWVTLPDHKGMYGKELVNEAVAKASHTPSKVEFFKVKTVDGVEMDGWMVKPNKFDPTKKYPIVFYVYSEPAGATVQDQYGTGDDFLYRGDMQEDGYIYASMDNRGTPAPKGRAWRKSIYRKIGIVNIRDQAMGAKELFNRMPFVDTSRVAVWGWSGGGSATLNLMFQYPDIYKTGISIAAVGNQLTYDNIYQERYMGLPSENREDFVNGSPITYAKNLRGKLLYIHGTGDDNVHYQNAEMLLNELIKYNKQFKFMAYPNRSHGISEGQGTLTHLQTMYTEFLRENCVPGAR
jgi:dipeptidyl-peptidase-4